MTTPSPIPDHPLDLVLTRQIAATPHALFRCWTEPELIRQALNKTYGNITAAAQLLEISRQNLNYKMKKYNLKRSDFKQQ